VSTNAYIVNMRPGLTRTRALTRITSWGSTNFDDLSLAGPISSLALSPKGDRLAFVTLRTSFPQTPPALITPQLSQVSYDQLYVADLGAGTLQLVSTGYDGQPANGYVTSPTFSAGNGPIAFASAATNLVFGAFSDVSGGDETFVTTERKPPAIPGHQVVGPPPPNPPIVRPWAIWATVHRLTGGGILLAVRVPGPGTVEASARTGRRAGDLRLARASARAHHAGLVTLRLVPGRRSRRLIDRTGGMYAILRVSFRARGRAPLSRRLGVDFLGSHRRHR
jgi:hypothetical protein